MAEVLPIRPYASRANEPPPAPETLSDEAAEMWEEIAERWVLGPDAIPLLRMGLEAWDRYRQAAAMLANEGPVVTNPKSGAVRQHPAHAVCRDNANVVRQCFRQLGLEPPASP